MRQLNNSDKNEHILKIQNTVRSIPLKSIKGKFFIRFGHKYDSYRMSHTIYGERERGKPSKNVRRPVGPFHWSRMGNFGGQGSEATIPERNHSGQGRRKQDHVTGFRF